MYDNDYLECIVKFQYGTEVGYREELIRCKDCKHYDEETGRCALLHVHGCVETWYCADGKRKEGR